VGLVQVNGHDCVVCPYHGWAFDGEGVLRDVPAAENEGEWPEKQLIDVFPVEEKVRRWSWHVLFGVFTSNIMLALSLQFVSSVQT
jgi:nitrite reductase/ring-hydroxylating ferredoxin subunit